MLPLASGVINYFVFVLNKSFIDLFIYFFLKKKVVSWTPMDAVSNCVMELIFQSKRLPPVLNVVHPRPTDWNTVIKLIGDALVSTKKLDSPLALVSFQEWFYILEAHAKAAANQVNENELRIVRLFYFLGGLTLFKIAILTCVFGL
jgi:hypothetical protein